MTTIDISQFQATNDFVIPMQSIAWTGAAILDVCSVRAAYGQLLLLTDDGALHGVDLDTGRCTYLCATDLPEVPPVEDSAVFGVARCRLHASSDGRHAAIVADHGQYGVLMEVASGTITMRLDGGNYHDNTVPFSACFFLFEGRDVFAHRTDWNRLDLADPATGQSLTDRHIATYESGGDRPAHYLDYFHGRLKPSPDGSRLFDDGWEWHPVAVPRTWSTVDWLKSNPWESEDGASIVDLTMREDWNQPACWIDNQRLVLWGCAEWVIEEFEEKNKGPGVRIFDALGPAFSQGYAWPMDTHLGKVQDLFSDGARLYVAAYTGTSVWDLATRQLLVELPGFIACLLDAKRKVLVAFGSSSVRVLFLPWLPAD